LGREKMRQVRVALALLAVGLVLVAACSGGETLLGERDSAADADEDRADVVDVPTDTAPICGNGVLESGEECDDGNTVAGDGCSPSCVVEYCGDGVTGRAVGLFEDFERLGPSAMVWTVHPAYGFLPTTAHVHSGSYALGSQNAGRTSSEVLATLRSPSDGHVCFWYAGQSEECCGDLFVFAVDGTTLLATSGDHTEWTEFCADVVPGPHEFTWTYRKDSSGSFGWDSFYIDDLRVFAAGTEQCDDDGTSVGDGCGPTCLFEVCGNGVVDPGEECDDDNLAPADGCSDTCFDECGSGIVSEGEACDDGPENSDTMPDACRTDCTIPRCGDGVADTGEQCDDGNEARDDECMPNCTVDCGNGRIDEGEECDNGPENSDTAADACRTDCTNPRCGDGAADAGEDCDLGDLVGQTCASLGHVGGRLACGVHCRVDESGCRDPDCGNGTCEIAETIDNCPADCVGGCGDGACGDEENQFTCPADCGAVVLSVGGGGGQTCVVLADRTLRCWGFWRSDADSEVPRKVSAPGGVAAVSTSGNAGLHSGGHYCAAHVDGAVSCWGSDLYGQLGDGVPTGGETATSPASPVRGLTSALAVEAVGVQSAASLADGSLWRWGSGYGALPVPITAIRDAVAISGNYALLSDGTVVPATGGPDDGIPIVGPTDVTSVSANDPQCFVVSDATVWCRNPDSGYSVIPGLPAAKAVAASSSHACALLLDGTVRCWGANESGQLGDGTTTHSDVPVTTFGLAESVAIGAGVACSVPDGPGTPTCRGSTCGLRIDGTAWCWGNGPLGDGTTTDSNVPVQVAAW
jgi:cysteine-rich repeat protein